MGLLWAVLTNCVKERKHNFCGISVKKYNVEVFHETRAADLFLAQNCFWEKIVSIFLKVVSALVLPTLL